MPGKDLSQDGRTSSPLQKLVGKAPATVGDGHNGTKRN
jgi:hypothetical protein